MRKQSGTDALRSHGTGNNISLTKYEPEIVRSTEEYSPYVPATVQDFLMKKLLHSPAIGGEDDVSNVSNGELGIMQYQRNVHEWGVLSPSQTYVLFFMVTAAPPFAHF